VSPPDPASIASLTGARFAAIGVIVVVALMPTSCAPACNDIARLAAKAVLSKVLHSNMAVSLAVACCCPLFSDRRWRVAPGRDAACNSVVYSAFFIFWQIRIAQHGGAAGLCGAPALA
jgi:hypothetical protein